MTANGLEHPPLTKEDGLHASKIKSVEQPWVGGFIQSRQSYKDTNREGCLKICLSQ